MSARDDYPALVVDDFPFAEAARQAEAALNEIDMLRQLVLDLYDPNDCIVMDDGVCDEHNSWDSRGYGRECPHRTARDLARRWRS